jgi:hypothetical protein
MQMSKLWFIRINMFCVKPILIFYVGWEVARSSIDKTIVYSKCYRKTLAYSKLIWDFKWNEILFSVKKNDFKATSVWGIFQDHRTAPKRLDAISKFLVTIRRKWNFHCERPILIKNCICLSFVVIFSCEIKILNRS